MLPKMYSGSCHTGMDRFMNMLNMTLGSSKSKFTMPYNPRQIGGIDLNQDPDGPSISTPRLSNPNYRHPPDRGYINHMKDYAQTFPYGDQTLYGLNELNTDHVGTGGLERYITESTPEWVDRVHRDRRWHAVSTLLGIGGAAVMHHHVKQVMHPRPDRPIWPNWDTGLKPSKAEQNTPPDTAKAQEVEFYPDGYPCETDPTGCRTHPASLLEALLTGGSERLPLKDEL